MLTSRKSFPSLGSQTIFSRRARHIRADKGIYSRRLGHLGKIIRTSLLRHFKKVHLNFHQFFFPKFVLQLKLTIYLKEKKLVKNHEYRIKPNIMARHNVIYIGAWCARDIPLGLACTRHGFDTTISLANQV